MADVNFIVDAINKSKSAFAEVEGDLKDLKEEAEESSKEFEHLQRAGRAAGLALLGIAAAGGMLLVSSVQLASRVETLGVVLLNAGKNAGYGADELRGFEDAVKDQGITTEAARQSLMQMIQAQLDLNDAAALARVAQNAAVVANINSSDAYMRLIDGIQRGETEILKTMGLTVDFARAYDEVAKASGRAAKDLTQVEKTQIRVQAVFAATEPIMGSYTAAMETSGKQAKSMERLIDELQLSIGDQLLGAYTDVTSSVYKLLSAWNKADEQTQTTIELFGIYSIAAAGVSGALLMLGSTVIPMVTTALGPLATAIGISTGGLSILLGLLAAGAAAGVASGQAHKQASASLKVLAQTAARTSETYEEYNRKMDAAEEKTGIASYTTEQLEERMGNLGNATYQTRGIIEDLTNSTHRLSDAEFELEEQVKGMMSDWEQMALLYDETGEILPEIAAKLQLVAAAEEEAAEAAKQHGAAIKPMNTQLGLTTISIGSMEVKVDELRESLIEYLLWLATDAPKVIHWLQMMQAAANNWGTAALRAATIALQAGVAPAAVSLGTTVIQQAADYGVELPGGFALGGDLPGHGVSVVGERGWEYIIGNTVIPHKLSKELAALGLRPQQGFAQDSSGSGGGGKVPDYKLPPLPPKDYTPSGPLSGTTTPAPRDTTPAPTGEGGSSPLPPAPVEAPPSVTEIAQAAAAGAASTFGASVATQLRAQERMAKQQMQGMKEMVEEIRRMAEEIPRSIRDELRGELG